MKSIISKRLALLAVCSALFSFTAKPGGEGFQIYLNNKVILQQFGGELQTVKSLTLSRHSADDQLIIKYHHCGRAGKNRLVTIKDGQNKVLKQFHFPDASTPVSAMNLKVNDLLSLENAGGTLKLFYHSTELPKGRMLAYINTGTTAASTHP